MIFMTSVEGIICHKSRRIFYKTKCFDTLTLINVLGLKDKWFLSSIDSTVSKNSFKRTNWIFRIFEKLYLNSKIYNRLILELITLTSKDICTTPILLALINNSSISNTLCLHLISTGIIQDYSLISLKFFVDFPPR